MPSPKKTVKAVKAVKAVSSPGRKKTSPKKQQKQKRSTSGKAIKSPKRSSSTTKNKQRRYAGGYDENNTNSVYGSGIQGNDNNGSFNSGYANVQSQAAEIQHVNNNNANYRDSSGIAKEDVLEYVEHLLGEYAHEIDRLSHVNPQRRMNEDGRLAAAVCGFASSQDTQYAATYGGDPVVRSAFDPSLTDDIFEIYLSQKKSQGDSTDSVLMHDAWALAKLFQYDPAGKMVAASEASASASSNEAVDITDDAYVLHDTAKSSKRLVRIPVEDGFAIVQERRLFQLVHFEKLDQEEAMKDTVPAKTLAALEQSDPGILSYIWQDIETVKIAFAAQAYRGGRVSRTSRTSRGGATGKEY